MRIGVLSDIHADSIALQQALAALDKLHCDRRVCLGDIVGFSDHYTGFLDGRDADLCIRLVREHCDHVVAGNHDLFAARRMPEFFARKGYPENWFDLEGKKREKISKGSAWLYEDEIEAVYSVDSIEFLAGLPEWYLMEDCHVMLTHFIYPDLSGSTSTAPGVRKGFRPHLRWLRRKRAGIGLAGHSHPEGYAEISGERTGMYGFRQNPIEHFPVILIAPAVSRGPVPHGIMVLDTNNMTVEALAVPNIY